MRVFIPVRALRDNQGMALLITIMVISLLIGITVQFNTTVRQNYFASATQLDGQYLRTIARSGFSIGTAVLEVDGMTTQFDTLLDSWATLDKESLAGLFSRGSLNLEITDFSGRLQVNSLVQNGGEGEQGENEQNANDNREILKRLLLSGNYDVEGDSEAREIVDALVDWLDSDDRESDFGAEESYYQSLDPSYGSQNGPVAVIEDLLLVKGITADLLFGSEARPGLADFLTVYGTDGKININTAPVELVQAMHSRMTEELATDIDEYRSEESNTDSLESPDWYKGIQGWPGDIVLSENVISTKSFFFRLRSEGVFHDQRRLLTAVVERDSKNKTAIIYQKVE